MSAQWIPAVLRAEVQRRAEGTCEYCRVHEDDVFVPHEPDHIIAEQHGGPTTEGNLALACYHCNRNKGANIASVDPHTGLSEFLFHPRRDTWVLNFRLEGSWIVPLTASGRATASLLKFNTASRLHFRETLVLGHRFPVQSRLS